MPPEQEIPTSAGMETATQTVDRIQSALQPTISANDLATPVQPVNPPMETPPEPNNRVGSLIGNVTRDTQGFITNQSEEAQRAREIAGEMASLSGQGSGDVRSTLNEQFQIPQNLQELRDIQLQLADRGTETNIQNTRIGQGNSIAQGNREITQNQRESAIRDAGLAARASVLQGNIETASTLVSQAVQDFNADRTFKNNQMINQLNYFQGLADEQTGQLLEQEKRKYQEDQRQITRAESAVDAAVSSGYATPDQMDKMLKLSADPAAQGDYARGIVAQGAIDQRLLDNMAQRSSIAASATARRKNLVELGMLGDPTAIAELGFDPGAEVRAAAEAENEQVRAQERIAADKEVARLDGVLEDITEILGNTTGLESSTGQFRNATITGLTPFVGNNLTEISGGLPGMTSARQDKDDWLAQVGNILTEQGFESLIDINERVRLTPITQMEVNLAFQAASSLQTAAIYKGSVEEGDRKLVGFAMSEDKVREAFADMYLATQTVQEEVKAIEEYGYEGYVRLMELEQQAQE